ncbi:MAG: glutamine amidotransferase [Amaricoccus sp.]
MDAVAFGPLLPLPLIVTLAAVALVGTALALWRGLTGWWLRGLAALVLLAALAGPSLRREDRTPVPSIAIVVIDDSASNRIAGRDAQVARALDGLQARLDALGQGGRLEVRTVHVADRGDDGTLLLSALADATAELPSDRIAGAILVTDGEIHDQQALATFPGPVQVLLTGSARDWDRRVVIETAPAFAIVGEPVSLVLKVEDLGAAPDGSGFAPLSISLDGTDPLRFDVPLNRDVTLPVTLQRGGVNVLQIATPAVDGELTDRNNQAIVSINGVRDRLRVLLVSGEPYPGERTWRNLLKSDSAVDLVHFTILRPPEKQDFVPVFELSLIAFPTQELFMEKVDEFDLIIFDRYKRRGILPNNYFDNIARYVRDGGALLIASGSDFAGAESLYRSPLKDILPVQPTARVIEEGFRPEITGIGNRHPVTAGLEEHAPHPPTADGEPSWGRWFRMVEVDASPDSETVMQGPEGKPLLVLDREGKGRVAVLASDEAWLWSRGFEGGGPQLELLRRLAHWLMKEPELEEEVLRGTGQDGTVMIERRTLADSVPPVTATSPSGAVSTVTLTETSPGLWQGKLENAENGVWRLENGDQKAVAVVGPSAPKEFANPVSSGDLLSPLATATRGGIRRLEDGMPDIRLVREGRVADGRGWIGLADREAYQLRDIRQVDLAPGWLSLLLAAGFVFVAWRIEGR